MTTEIVEKLGDSSQYSKRRDVVSDSGNKYRIAIRKSDGRWTCSCTGWTNVCNKKGSDCKHIKGLKQRYGEFLNDNFAGSFSNLIVEIQSIRTLAVKNPDRALEMWMASKDKIDTVTSFLELLEDSEKLKEINQEVTYTANEVMAAIG